MLGRLKRKATYNFEKFYKCRKAVELVLFLYMNSLLEGSDDGDDENKDVGDDGDDGYGDEYDGDDVVEEAISGYPLQVEEQKFELDRLRRELEEKIAEVTRIKATLQSSERVNEHRP